MSSKNGTTPNFFSWGSKLMDNLWEFSISPLKSSVLSIVCVGNTVTLVLCHVFLNEHFFFPLTKLGVNISYLFDGNFGIHLVIFFSASPEAWGCPLCEEIILNLIRSFFSKSMTKLHNQNRQFFGWALFLHGFLFGPG